MNRRKFLNIGVMTTALLPLSLSAIDFRKTKPAIWTSDNVQEAIEGLYGNIKTIEGDVKLNAPKVASNGGSIPVSIKSDLDAKTVALFQDANPEATVCVFDVPNDGIVDYSIKIKMKSSGKITAIVEGKDGNFYIATKSLEVALGGCEG